MSKKPQAPPISYRPGSERAERMARYALSHGLKGNEVIHRLIDRGLQSEGFGPAGKRKAPKPALASATFVAVPEKAHMVDADASRDRWSLFRTPAKAKK